MKAGVKDVDRLRLEMETLWGTDLYGRPAGPEPLVAVAVAGDGWAVRFGSGWPEGRARPSEAELLALSDAELGARLLNGEAVEARGGPSYVFEEGWTPPAASRGIVASGRIVASDEPTVPELRGARPRAWGDDAEWEELLVGRLGPWAIVVEEGRVLAVCYTPVASRVAAEAGVWTLPEARGRGLAGAATAAWARAAAPTFETRFYSTSHGNAASQAVARKLGLRPIGRLWQLHRRVV